ncbi:uncharacterized protein [Ambystoma mexicanum]|uniref:uncharacterized protein n=1 Tax=Ambystoma mexicanum TaxID=8296 RepID=UPI0037E8DE22
MMALPAKRSHTRRRNHITERDHYLLKFVKHHLPEHLPKWQLDPLKVLTRTAATHITEPDDGNWKRTYERRKAMQYSGFFTPVSRPYSSVGIFIPAHQDLFTNVLKSEDLEAFKKLCAKRYRDHSSPHLVLDYDKDEDEDHKVAILRHNNGYSYIREDLEELRLMRMAIVSKQPIPAFLKEVERKLSMKGLLQKEAEAAAREADVPASPASENYKALKEMVSIIEPLEILDPEEREKVEKRNRKYVLEKLENVYMLLCGMLAMKSTDLARARPMSQRYVKRLTKDFQRENKTAALSLPRIVKRRGLYLAPVLEDLKAQEPEYSWEGMFTEQQDLPPSPPNTRRIKNWFIARMTKGKDTFPEFDTNISKLPPWLTFLLDQIDFFEDLKNPVVDKHTSIDKYMTKFANLQLALSDKTAQEFADRKLSQIPRMQLLLKSLDPKHGDNLVSTLAALKKLVRKRVPVTHPSSWFQELEAECRSLVSEFDQPMRDLLIKLSSLHRHHVHTMHYAKEKLCLLTVSLPIMKLLQPMLQESLVFIMKHVIELPSDEIAMWYQFKNLPITLYS